MSRGKKTGILHRLLGPRVPPEALRENPDLYRRPSWLFAGAALALLVSVFFPYWQLNLRAPQYPEGLVVRAYVNRLEGDTAELDGLNHYVGLPSLEQGAPFERSIAVAAIAAVAGLLLTGLLIHTRWVVVFTLPALLFPLVFLADLQFWLWKYGHSLDPKAPLAGAIGEFTPPVFGPAKIAQFQTLALPHVGFFLALVASVMVGLGLWYHRTAYKPLVEEQTWSES